MITSAPKRELTLNYSIAKVKKAISETVQLSGFMLKEKNDVLGTYKIAIVKGFKVGLMNITLNQLEDEKTHCVFEIINAVGGVAQPATLSSLQDEFLTAFSNLLSGKTVLKLPTKGAPAKKGCALPFLVLLVIILFSLIYYF